MSDEEDRVRLACATCWEHLGGRVRFVDHVAAPFARCDMCGTAGEDEEIIEYEWKEAGTCS